jgi:DNA transposition AAA+ family ATPase
MNKEQITTALEDYLKRTSTSQNKFSKQAAVSSATISQMLQRKWELISTEMWQRIARVLHINGDWAMVRTRNYNAVLKLCHEAQHHHRMLAVSAFTGSGKTAALVQYSQHNAQAYYTMATVLWGKKQFLQHISQAIGIGTTGTLADRMDAIIDHLREQEHPILIIDDAGKLSDGVLRLVQVLYDALEGACGIVLAGTEYLQRYIDKMALKDKMGFRELRRRIGIFLPLHPPTPKVVAEICTANGISDQPCIDYIIRMAKDYGSIREMITNALRASQANGEALTIHTFIQSQNV